MNRKCIIDYYFSHNKKKYLFHGLVTFVLLFVLQNFVCSYTNFINIKKVFEQIDKSFYTVETTFNQKDTDKNTAVLEKILGLDGEVIGKYNESGYLVDENENQKLFEIISNPEKNLRSCHICDKRLYLSNNDKIVYGIVIPSLAKTYKLGERYPFTLLDNAKPLKEISVEIIGYTDDDYLLTTSRGDLNIKYKEPEILLLENPMLDEIGGSVEIYNDKMITRYHISISQNKNSVLKRLKSNQNVIQMKSWTDEIANTNKYLSTENMHNSILGIGIFLLVLINIFIFFYLELEDKKTEFILFRIHGATTKAFSNIFINIGIYLIMLPACAAELLILFAGAGMWEGSYIMNSLIIWAVFFILFLIIVIWGVGYVMRMDLNLELRNARNGLWIEK